MENNIHLSIFNTQGIEQITADKDLLYKFAITGSIISVFATSIYCISRKIKESSIVSQITQDYCGINGIKKEDAIAISTREAKKIKKFSLKHNKTFQPYTVKEHGVEKVFFGNEEKDVEIYSKYKVMNSYFHPLRKSKYEDIVFLKNDNPLFGELGSMGHKVSGVHQGIVIDKTEMLNKFKEKAEKQYEGQKIVVECLDTVEYLKLQHNLSGDHGCIKAPDCIIHGNIGDITFVSHPEDKPLFPEFNGWTRWQDRIK